MAAGDSPDFTGLSNIANQFVPTANTVYLGTKVITVTDMSHDVGLIRPDTNLINKPIALNGMYFTMSIDGPYIQYFDVLSILMGVVTPNDKWFPLSGDSYDTTKYPSVGFDYSPDDLTFGAKKIYMMSALVSQVPEANITCINVALPNPIHVTINFYGITSSGSNMPVYARIGAGPGINDYTPLFVSRVTTESARLVTAQWTSGTPVPYTFIPGIVNIKSLHICLDYRVDKSRTGVAASAEIKINGNNVVLIRGPVQTSTVYDLWGAENESLDLGDGVTINDLTLSGENDANAVFLSWLEAT